MNLLVVLLLACSAPAAEPELPLGAQISLTVDYSLRDARLAVATFVPVMMDPPEERQGLGLDQCDTLVPVSAREGLRALEREPEAECGGQPLPLASERPGMRSYYFAVPPEPGLRCSVLMQGVRVPMPPLPAPPDLDVGRLRLRWTPGRGDELRAVWPRKESLSTVCRLTDDGDAPAPRSTVGRFGFSTRIRTHRQNLVNYAAAVTVTAGRWLGR